MFRHVKLDREVPRLQRVNEDGTRFYATPEGNKYPSVTTVLSEYSRQAIQEWRARVGNEEANRVSNKASSRGTKFHKACEDYLKNLPVTFSTPLEVELFNRFKPVLHRIDNIHGQELMMYSDHLRIAGTVDCVAEFDGKLAIIDFKTASKEKKKDWIGNYMMQCTAYAIMFEERFGIPVSKTVVAIAVDECEPQIFVEKRDSYVDQLLHYRNLYEEKVIYRNNK